jgi:hypothetical protein
LKSRGLLLTSLLLPSSIALAQGLELPRTITAGSPFSISTSGSGKSVLTIVGLGQVLRHTVQLGAPASFAAGEIFSAGHYLAILGDGPSASVAEFDVTPAHQVASLGFLAKPSRLPVNVHNGISGAVYVFDPYRNLITTPMPAVLELAGAGVQVQTRNVTTKNGLAWTTLDSAAKESAARFTARVGAISSTRIIDQVPGEPCAISITARPSGSRLEVQTAPVKDCSGNIIPDGTIVTFMEATPTSQTTVDVPLKRGVATINMPANPGSKISAAIGVVVGNEIRWGGAR